MADTETVRMKVSVTYDVQIPSPGFSRNRLLWEMIETFVEQDMISRGVHTPEDMTPEDARTALVVWLISEYNDGRIHLSSVTEVSSENKEVK
jgi:hypothetical protein